MVTAGARLGGPGAGLSAGRRARLSAGLNAVFRQSARQTALRAN